MDQRSNSRLSLFLMELIVAIMFFSLSAAVCVRLFASAHIMSENTKNIANATIWTQNLAESFEGNKGNLSEIAKSFPYSHVTYDPHDTSMKDGAIVMYFDENWQTLDSLAGASYVVYMNVITKDASIVYGDITDYGVTYEGKASTANVGAIDVRGIEEFEYELPEQYNSTILSFDVDHYLGKEAD